MFEDRVIDTKNGRVTVLLFEDGSTVFEMWVNGVPKRKNFDFPVPERRVEELADRFAKEAMEAMRVAQ